jgi:hypothetical protein
MSANPLLDATALTSSGIGANGPDAQALASQVDPARRAPGLTLARRTRAEIGVLDLPADRAQGELAYLSDRGLEAPGPDPANVP